MKTLSKKAVRFFSLVGRDTLDICKMLFRIMIPVSIAIRILTLFDAQSYLAMALSPFMKLVGLPGDSGIVWAAAMLTNLYGGIIAYCAILPKFHLSIAQASVLTVLMLFAHNIIVELQIAKKAGVAIAYMLPLRVLGAMVYGALAFWLLNFTHVLQEPAIVIWNGTAPDPSWQAWVMGQLHTYIKIFAIVFTLLVVLRVLERLRIIELLTWMLRPFLKPVGIDRAGVPMTMVGAVLGLAYGGGLIIKEAHSGKLSKRETLACMTFLGMCHSFFEDTILMLLLGGNFWVIFMGRLVFAWIVTAISVRVYDRLIPVS